MNEKELLLRFVEYVHSQHRDQVEYSDRDYCDYIFEQERRRMKSQLRRLRGLEEIVNNWKKHADDFKKRICAVDPAPTKGNTGLWLFNNAYTAINNFLSQYSVEYRKRNKGFGSRRIYVATRKLDKDTANDLADIIYKHLEKKIDVGVVFEEDVKGIVDPRFYNCNVVAKRMATDAEHFEENEEHLLQIVDKKTVIKDMYENYRILWKSAVRFNNNDIRIDVRSLPANIRRRITLPPPLKFYVWLRNGGVCANCGSSVGIQFDHVYPRSKGGSDHIDNFQLLCDGCNQRKSNSI